MKRGFTTRRDAQKWENNFKVYLAGNLDMSFGEFVKIYKEERFPRLKESTRVMKENVIATHILPYFEARRINEISSTDIIKWQNELLTAINPNTGKTYAKSYLKTIHNQINAISIMRAVTINYMKILRRLQVELEVRMRLHWNSGHWMNI